MKDSEPQLPYTDLWEETDDLIKIHPEKNLSNALENKESNSLTNDDSDDKTNNIISIDKFRK